jgi:hypothetical protein
MMDLSTLSDADLMALKAGDLSKVSDQGLMQMKGAKAPAAGPTGFVGGGNAVGTGYFRGLGRLAGLPVDTVMNVVDLAKAGIGAPYQAVTGKAAPEWTMPSDRSKILGTGENILGMIRNAGASAMIDPANPAYEGGYLQGAGGAANGLMRPNTWAQAGNQLALAETGAAAAKAVGDSTGNQALAITAGMLPTAGQLAVTEGTKYAVRGGERGRREMEQRVADLKAAGVENPTLGLASGNKLIGGVENILQSTPGAVGIMQRNRDTAISGLEASTGIAADLASTNRGALQSGRSIQAGAADFKAAFKDSQGRLYDKLGNIIGPQHPTNVGNTRASLADLNADIPTMPELSKQFKNSRIMAIEAALKSDMAGTSARPGGTQAVVVNGIPMLQNGQGTPAVPARTDIPFDAVKKTRTLVGGEIADNSMMSDVPRSKWNPLYGSLTEDIKGAAAAVGPDATNAFNRANTHTRTGIDRLERIAPVVDRPAPEQSFTALNSTLKENVSTFQAVKKSLPTDARGDFAGTVIERLGKAKPGQQDATGEKWSPETFLTNWSGLKPQARDALLSGIPNAPEVRSLIDSVAKVTAMMRENSKMWANPSGTSANASARAVLGAVGLGGAGSVAGLLNPLIPIGAGAALGGVNMLARGVTSPNVRNAMMRRTDIDPELLNALYSGMVGSNALNQQPKK